MNSSQRTLDSTDVAEMVLASLSVPVVVLDAALCAVTANESFCAFVCLSEDALLGKSIDELIVDGPQLPDVLSRIVADDVDMEVTEVVCTTPANKRRILAVSGRRLPVSSSEPALVVVELRDITEQRSVMRQYAKVNEALRRHGADLEQANQELDAFAFCIAHDLRSPLRLTSRIAHSLLDDYGDELPEGGRHLVNLILTGTEEMGDLTGNLLRFSQISREPMKKRRVSMQHVVRESIAELHAQHPDRDVHFEVETLIPSYGNRALLKQLLLNLLENALKFTSESEHPEIHIGCTQSNDGPVYFVRDNGIGFDSSDAESMFLVFRRLHRTSKIEGSGVGLAISKRIVERHYGRIWAEGEPGRGATIYFTLENPTAESRRLDERAKTS